MSKTPYEKLMEEIERVENARKCPPLTLEDFMSEFEWLIAEYALCEYKIYDNVIFLNLFNGQKFRLSIEEIKKTAQDDNCLIKG